jgi:hypothetical protein
VGHHILDNIDVFENVAPNQNNGTHILSTYLRTYLNYSIVLLHGRQALWWDILK